MKRPLEAVIEDVIVDPQKIQPIIVNFQNGQLKDEDAKKMECGMFRDEKSNKTVLAMSNGKVVYKGCRPNPDKELTHTMIAVYNKKTGKMKLIGAERWNVAPVLNQEIMHEEMDDREKVITLNKQFGSKKMKRRTEQYEKMAINVSAMKNQLDITASNADNQQVLPLPHDPTSHLYLPPCNREAAAVSDVYDMHDIIPKEVLKTLYNAASDIMERGFGEGNRFFTEMLNQMGSSHKMKKNVAALLFIKAVSVWLSMSVKDTRQKDAVIANCFGSCEIADHITNNYTMSSPTGRQRPPVMKDKGIVHCIILGLMIGGYSLDLELLATIFNFRLGIKKVMDLAKLVGAVPLKDNKNVFVLKLPLPKPVSMLVIKRGRKK